MEPTYRPAAGIVKARGGTPEILSLLALDAALDVWDGVTIDQVRAKSLRLTEFFIRCVDELVPAGALRCVTPLDEWRGSQVSLACDNAGAVMDALIDSNVVGDFRQPDILRFGFAPLYICFADALRAATVLADVVP